MVYNTKKMKLIERYFNEELSPEELEFFEEELVRDEKFKEEVQQFEFVFGGLKEARVRKLKADFDKYEQQISTHKSTRYSFIRKPMCYSIASTIVIAVVVWVFNIGSVDNRIQSNDLFSEYFKPYPNVLAPITRSSEASSTSLSDAMSLYDSKQYDKAILGFNQLIEEPVLKNEILFYKGVALLAKGEASEALYHFDLMAEVSSFNDQRKWYLSLTYIQLEDVDNAVVLLHEIINDQSYFMVYAEDLLEVFVPKE